MAATILQFPARRPRAGHNEHTATNPENGTLTPAPEEPSSETPEPEIATAMAAIVVAAGAILSIAHGLVKQGWSHRCAAKNARNQACAPDDPDATAWSADGAIWLAAKMWREEVNRQNGRTAPEEQAPLKGAALHRHHSGPRCPEEIMALETVLQTVGLPVNHNCRETLGMWNRTPVRKARDADDALAKARASLKSKSALALDVLQAEKSLQAPAGQR